MSPNRPWYVPYLVAFPVLGIAAVLNLIVWTRPTFYAGQGFPLEYRIVDDTPGVGVINFFALGADIVVAIGVFIGLAQIIARTLICANDEDK